MDYTDTDKKGIGQRIRKVRQNIEVGQTKGITQKELAKRIGLVDISLVSKWELGKKLPSLVNAVNIANLGEYSLDWLIYGETRDKTPNDEDSNG